MPVVTLAFEGSEACKAWEVGGRDERSGVPMWVLCTEFRRVEEPEEERWRPVSIGWAVGSGVGSRVETEVGMKAGSRVVKSVIVAEVTGGGIMGARSEVVLVDVESRPAVELGAMMPRPVVGVGVIWRGGAGQDEERRRRCRIEGEVVGMGDFSSAMVLQSGEETLTSSRS